MSKMQTMSVFSGGGATNSSLLISNTSKCKHAFTLAEVLITLGIIGVVAAMLLPSVVAYINDKVLDTQAQKAINVVHNGYKLMMARSEIVDSSDIQFVTSCSSLNDTECVSQYHKSAFNVIEDTKSGFKGQILPDKYFVARGSTEEVLFKWSDMPYVFVTADGFVYGINKNNKLPDAVDIYVDVNSIKRPNIALSDLRKFRLTGKGDTVRDVSSELLDTKVCSIETPGACSTSQECYSLNDQLPWNQYANWSDGTCKIKKYVSGS